MGLRFRYAGTPDFRRAGEFAGVAKIPGRLENPAKSRRDTPANSPAHFLCGPKLKFFGRVFLLV